MGSPLNSISFVLATFAVFVASAAMAVQVATVAELEAAVERGDTPIELTASEYKITKTLVFKKVSNCVVGRSGNARDTVIYGDGTFPIVDFNSNKCTGGAIRNLTISNGWAQASGGGTSTSGVRGYANGGDGGRHTLSNVVVTCCTIAVNGGSNGNGAGASFCYLRHCVVSGNKVYSNNAEARGGGIQNCICYDTDICDNKIECTNAKGSGGGGTSSRLYRCRVYGNTASAQGGGLANSSIYEGTVVSNNTAGSIGGGLASCSAYDSEICLNLVNTTVSKGRCFGGGVADCAMVSNCVIRGNAIDGVSDAQGRIGAAASASTLRKCRVYDNFTTAAAGGGMSYGLSGENKVPCLAYDCVFSNNCNQTAGATFRVVQAENCIFYGASCDYSCRFVGCQFRNLSPATDAYYLAPGANRLGSGYYPGTSAILSAYHSGSAEAIYATNCLFACNTSASYAFNKSSADTLELVNCTFVDNHLRCMMRDRQKTETTTTVPLTFINCAFPRNYTDAENPVRRDVSVDAGENRNIVFRNCLFGPNKYMPDVTFITPESGSVNDVTDMKFDTKNAAHPYSLKRNSPAIGKGLYQDWMASATDLKGDARAHGTAVAIGCYECWLKAPGLLLLLR